MSLSQKRGLKNMPHLNNNSLTFPKRESARNMMLQKLTVMTTPEKLAEKRPAGGSAMLRIDTKLDDEDYIKIEDFDAEYDQRFIDEWLRPYLRDVYADLKMRSN